MTTKKIEITIDADLLERAKARIAYNYDIACGTDAGAIHFMIMDFLTENNIDFDDLDIEAA
jgi:hypothetical protein